MTLIAIDSYAKHQQIDNLLKRLYSKYFIGLEENCQKNMVCLSVSASCPPVWISGNDNAVHLRYEWASTGEPFSFTNWGPNQPADAAKDEHCILMWKDFQWHDYPCTNKLGYICEENHLMKGRCQKPWSNRANDINELKNLLFYFNNGK